MNKNNYYDDNKHFYVCSYGGCGSWMLVRYLSNFGKTYHIHSRNPPEKLTYVGSNEWFNNKEISENNLINYKVIYIYRNPIHSIYSRFENSEHLKHIQCNDSTIKLKDVIKNNLDLYNLEEFFDNYTQKKIKNYNIYCVKYETILNNIQKFNEIIGIKDIPKLYPVMNKTNKKYNDYELLYKIYENLINKMNNLDDVYVL
jgi:hypothetical protein